MGGSRAADEDDKTGRFDIHVEFTAASCSLHATRPSSPLILPLMKRSSALLFQIAIVFIGLGGLAFLLGEPHLEGRNAHATLFEIYFKDPFLAFTYAGSVPFSYALHRAFIMFGQVRRTGAFSAAALETLRTIQRCAIALIGFVAVGVVIILNSGDGEDRPAGIFLSLLVAVPAGVVAIAAARFARRLRNFLTTSDGRRG